MNVLPVEGSDSTIILTCYTCGGHGETQEAPGETCLTCGGSGLLREVTTIQLFQYETPTHTRGE